MVDTSLAAFRLLELIALLFPVVALLVQLQHRVADSVELEELGLIAGMSLLLLLSLSFLHLSAFLIATQSLPSLLKVPLGIMSFLSLALPILIVLSSTQFTDSAKDTFSVILVESKPSWWRRLQNSDVLRPHEGDDDEE